MPNEKINHDQNWNNLKYQLGGNIKPNNLHVWYYFNCYLIWLTTIGAQPIDAVPTILIQELLVDSLLVSSSGGCLNMSWTVSNFGSPEKVLRFYVEYLQGVPY